MHRRTLLKTSAASFLAAPAIAQPARTATLRLIPQANLAVLDPIFTTAIVTGNHAYHVFDTLYSCAADGVPRPQMAEGQEVSADGLTWRIRLRPGLVFHDGTPVRGVDCVASIQRWCQRDPFGQLLAKAVDRWDAPDDRTMELRLSRPFPLLLTALGKPDASAPFIMPERLARTDGTTQVTEMMGSGPHRFVAAEYNTGNRVVYERFDRYVPRDGAPDWATGGKVAHFPRVEWSIVPDAATAAAALQNGEVNWWEQPLTDLLPSLARNRDITLAVAEFDPVWWSRSGSSTEASRCPGHVHRIYLSSAARWSIWSAPDARPRTFPPLPFHLLRRRNLEAAPPESSSRRRSRRRARRATNTRHGTLPSAGLPRRVWTTSGRCLTTRPSSGRCEQPTAARPGSGRRWRR